MIIIRERFLIRLIQVKIIKLDQLMIFIVYKHYIVTNESIIRNNTPLPYWISQILPVQLNIKASISVRKGSTCSVKKQKLQEILAKVRKINQKY